VTDTTTCASDHMTEVYSAPASSTFGGRPFPAGRVQIYVGDGFAAQDVATLEACLVRRVLNVAYDLDDRPQNDLMLQLNADPHRPSPQPASNDQPLARYAQQFAKVGLIDGTHNPAGIMALLSAVYVAEQLLWFPETDVPCPPLVNPSPPGNLLIHCWNGGSRSVTVAALFLWYKFGVQLGDPSIRVAGRSDEENFDALYNCVKAKRGGVTGTHPDGCEASGEPAWFTPTPPTLGMQKGAHDLVRTYSEVFPLPVARAR